MKNVKNEMERQLYKKPRTTAEPAMRAKMISRIVIKAEPVINCIGGRRKNMTRPETKEKVPARSRIRAFLASSSMISWNCVVKFSIYGICFKSISYFFTPFVSYLLSPKNDEVIYEQPKMKIKKDKKTKWQETKIQKDKDHKESLIL